MTNTRSNNNGIYGAIGLILGFIIGFALDTFILTTPTPIGLIIAPPLCMFAGITLHKLSTHNE